MCVLLILKVLKYTNILHFLQTDNDTNNAPRTRITSVASDGDDFTIRAENGTGNSKTFSTLESFGYIAMSGSGWDAVMGGQGFLQYTAKDVGTNVGVEVVTENFDSELNYKQIPIVVASLNSNVGDAGAFVAVKTTTSDFKIGAVELADTDDGEHSPETNVDYFAAPQGFIRLSDS